MAELVIPDEITRTVTVKRFPGWLQCETHRLMIGWLFTGMSGDRLANGKWMLNLTFKRSDGRISIGHQPDNGSVWFDHNGDPVRWCDGHDAGSEHMMEVESFQVYRRASIRTTLRMLWLLLWSKPYQEETPT